MQHLLAPTNSSARPRARSIINAAAAILFAVGAGAVLANSESGPDPFAGAALAPTAGAAPLASTFTLVAEPTSVNGQPTRVLRSASTALVALDQAELAHALVGQPYSLDLRQLTTAHRGIDLQAATYSLVWGALPAGLSLAPSGLISGTPLAAGVKPAGQTFTIEVTHTDSAAQMSYELVVDEVGVRLASAALPIATVGQPYHFDFKSLTQAINGPGIEQVIFTVEDGAFPPGLLLAVDGVLSGTPQAETTGKPATVKARYTSASGQQAYEVVAVNVLVSLAKAQIPHAMVGKSYRVDMQAHTSVHNGPGIREVQYNLASGSLPQGLALSPQGQIHGTPTQAAGAQPFTIAATYAGVKDQLTYSLLVNDHSLEVTKIAAGDGFACAITPQGGVKCWGAGTDGQLGHGAYEDASTPVNVSGLASGVTAITTGDKHACAIQLGTTFCWGSNVNGQLGAYAAVGSANVPVKVSREEHLPLIATAIAAGNAHTCAVADGAVLCWGLGTSGQLGNGSGVSDRSPRMAMGLHSGVTTISAGFNYSCAIQAGAAKCWGLGVSGQLGQGMTSSSFVPVRVSGLNEAVTQISAGRGTTCAVHAGIAKCWGLRLDAERGEASASARYRPQGVATIPQAVGALSPDVRAISVGRDHACAVYSTEAASGLAKCWGAGKDGQLGTGEAADSKVPAAVHSLAAGVSDIAAGDRFTCAVHNGAGSCWGLADAGRLGGGPDRQPVIATNPVPVHP